MGLEKVHPNAQCGVGRRTGMCLLATKDVISLQLSGRHMYYMTTSIHPGIYLREMQLMSTPNAASKINPKSQKSRRATGVVM